MQKCLVEINRGNISAYKLSLISLEKETMYSKSFKYYKEINELLIMRYKRCLNSVLNEMFSLKEFENCKKNVKVRIILEENKEIIRGIKMFLKNKNIKNIDVINRDKYKKEMYRKINKEYLNIWEEGGAIYIGYYKNNIRIINELFTVFEKDKFDQKMLLKRLILFDFINIL